MSNSSRCDHQLPAYEFVFMHRVQRTAAKAEGLDPGFDSQHYCGKGAKPSWGHQP